MKKIQKKRQRKSRERQKRYRPGPEGGDEVERCGHSVPGGGDGEGYGA